MAQDEKSEARHRAYSAASAEEGHVEGKLTDVADAVASRRMRTLIFALICQGVQTFMSYDGGATPATVDIIEREMINEPCTIEPQTECSVWTTSELGILGAMDKIGMTLLSSIWGRALQVLPVKVLLVMGLCLNAAGTFLYGDLRNKYLMFTDKFVLGATQALQGVWSTTWTMTMAPPESRTAWLGLGGISAGLGNGIGTIVAGFGTGAAGDDPDAQNTAYAWTFRFQAIVLFGLWIFLAVIPSGKLVLKLPSTKTDAANTEATEQSSVSAQLRSFWNNRIYVWTCLAIALSNFVMSGAQFLWIRFFMDVWAFDKNFVTLMFLIVTGIGGAIGISIGPAYIDKLGGYETSPGVCRSLSALKMIVFAEAAAGLLALLALFGKNQMQENWGPPLGDHWFWTLQVAMFVLWFCHNFCIPGLTGIYMSVLPENMRSLGSGVEITVRNIFGQACGPMLPGFWMDIVVGVGIANTTGDDFTRRKSQLTWAFGVIAVANLLQVFLIGRASSAADKVLHDERMTIVHELQKAIAETDVEALERGMKSARRVNLGADALGQPIVATAGEILGELRGGMKREKALSACWWLPAEQILDAAKERSASNAQESRMDTLEKENVRLRTENEALKKQVEAIKKEKEMWRRKVQVVDI